MFLRGSSKKLSGFMSIVYLRGSSRGRVQEDPSFIPYCWCQGTYFLSLERESEEAPIGLKLHRQLVTLSAKPLDGGRPSLSTGLPLFTLTERKASPEPKIPLAEPWFHTHFPQIPIGLAGNHILKPTNLSTWAWWKLQQKQLHFTCGFS